MIAMPVMIILKNGKTSQKDTENNPNIIEESNIKIITFAVPDICRIDDDKLQEFNDELVKDGHGYMLEIKYLAYEEYTEVLKSELKSGDIDIAFLGLGNSNGTNDIYEIINSGLVLELDGILSQEQGNMLYNAFPQNLWESVKCNRHIYSIPSTLVNDQGVYAAFNKDYISEVDIENWNGSIDEIYEMIKLAEWDNDEAPAFQYLINEYGFEDMIECEVRNGLLFDYESQSVENPLESEKFTGYFQVLERMKQDGYIAENVSYINNSGLNNVEISKNIKDGNYMVALASGTVNDAFLKDNIIVKRITPYLSSRINGSIAISNNADDIDSVVDFLSLLYADGKYGNILLYGQEGTDYKVIDGVAFNTDGSELDDNYITKLCLNLFVNVYPVSGENYMKNRKDEFFSFYDGVNLSPFIGFEADTTEIGSISNDIDDFIYNLEDMSVDEAVLSFTDKLKSDGIEKYLNGVISQWEEYRR